MGSSGYKVAIDGGCVMGLSLVCIGVIDLFALIMAFKPSFKDDPKAMYEAIAGYGLGGSSIALFGRVGGGIYTKAADVGADLSGKNDYGLEEDDYRNPACIADNVGDNVGDIAGMGADLFGSFAESSCAALVLAASTDALKDSWCAMMYPVLISSTGIIVGILTLIICGLFYSVREMPDVEKALKGVLVISTILMTPVSIGLSFYCLPDHFKMNDDLVDVHWWHCAARFVVRVGHRFRHGVLHISQLHSGAGDFRDPEAVGSDWHHLWIGIGVFVVHHSRFLPRNHYLDLSSVLRYVRSCFGCSWHARNHDHGFDDRCIWSHF